MNLEFPQYLENSQSNPLQKEKVVFCNAEYEPLPFCSGAPEAQFSSDHVCYFSKPVTRTGKKTNLIFDYLKLLSCVTHSVTD